MIVTNKFKKDFLFFIPFNSEKEQFVLWCETKTVLYEELKKYLLLNVLNEASEQDIKIFLKFYDRNVNESSNFSFVLDSLEDKLAAMQLDLSNFSFAGGFIGTYSELLSVKRRSAIKMREAFRSYLYGINFGREINIGSRPIELLEAIRFREFLGFPIPTKSLFVKLTKRTAPIDLMYSEFKDELIK